MPWAQERALQSSLQGPFEQEDVLIRFILRWILISILILGNVVVLAILAVIVYARLTVGEMLGRGPSPSEFAAPYIVLIITSGAIGLLALAATVLYWLVGLFWVPSLRCQSNKSKMIMMMKLSLVVIPLWFFLVFLLSRMR